MAVDPAPAWPGKISQIINRAEVDDSLEAGFAESAALLLLLETVLAPAVSLVAPLFPSAPPPFPVIAALAVAAGDAAGLDAGEEAALEAAAVSFPPAGAEFSEALPLLPSPPYTAGPGGMKEV
jgi:hypothetical protein